MNELAPNVARQQRALEWAIALATASMLEAGEPLAGYEQEMSEQSLPPLALGVYHLLYCSKAARMFDEEQLADLLECSLVSNTQLNITGLLCYGYGHFIQVLEGNADDVESLFARIRSDNRHHRVQVLSRGVGPARRFADWRMAFTKDQTHEFYWLITCLEAHRHHLLLRQIPVAEPRLAATLKDFSTTCLPKTNI